MIIMYRRTIDPKKRVILYLYDKKYSNYCLKITIMIVLIPLGGTGQRFKKNHYKEPKALVRVFGKPIIGWLLDSLIIPENGVVCIPYNKEYIPFRLEDLLRKTYPHINFHFLPLMTDTEGAAETINIALKTLTLRDQPVICLDSDNFYGFNILEKWNKKNCIFTFTDTNSNPIYSYIETDGVSVKNIVEKQKISNQACTGAYGFTSYKELIHYTQHILDKKMTQNNEYYTSGVIQEMLKGNHMFSFTNIERDEYICLGTPLQVKSFYHNFPKVSCKTSEQKIKEMRICFDLDNTLVTYPMVKDDYTTVQPVTRNIEYLRYLKSFGHTIIVYTARRMKTHKGNVGKILSDIGKITFDTLEKFEIPYDEIYFGKPQADFYIDDLAVNCFDNMEKCMGFYMNEIKPRDFNQIEQKTIDTLTKRSNCLEGEIYYYNHIPKELKDMFPLLIDYDEDNTWYTMEKIKGLSLSDYYISELLTEELLKHIMNSIRRIQNTKICENESTNIYENYSRKLQKRFQEYDYSVFPKHQELYIHLLDELVEYEKKGLGKKTIIHGDAVGTNIIINEYGKIKFIDMRGKNGTENSIYGDWLYDWAKLYQSLIGYDKILLDKMIRIEYEKKMINCFEKYFAEMFSTEDLENVKLITKSLLFSLIPLHDNDKCKNYYALMSSL